jgi:hypothetical protein
MKEIRNRETARTQFYSSVLRNEMEAWSDDGVVRVSTAAYVYTQILILEATVTVASSRLFKDDCSPIAAQMRKATS